MLFRKHDGTLVEINKCDYANDVIYYKKIMEVTMGKFTDTDATNDSKSNYSAKDSYSTQAIQKLLCLC